MILVEGNPMTEIAATERVITVVYKGERVVRSELLEGAQE